MFDIQQLSNTPLYHKRFKAGDVIFTDGEASDGNMYVLLRGKAGVYKNHSLPAEILIAELDPGAFFGEMALFLDMQRTSTVAAIEDVLLYRFDRESTLAFINSQPETSFKFMQALCSKILVSNATSATVSHEKQEAKTLANKDPLTGAHNRRYFMDASKYLVATATIRAEQFFMAIFDLDFFKKINDIHGHQAGDHVLVEFAALMHSLVRSDDIFARYGGEEFILLATCNNKYDAAIFIDRLRKAVMNMIITFEGKTIPVTTSIGVVELGVDGDIENSIALADVALYHAKANGRNRIEFYEKGMN